MPPLLVSLGMFILDEHLFLSDEARASRPEGVCIGGGGIYAVIGARMWLDAGQAVNAVVRGSDWSPEHTEALDQYGVAHYVDDPSEKTVRSRFTYTSATDWKWDLLTAPVRCFPAHLAGTAAEGFLWLHNLNYPENYHRTLKELDELGWSPRLCWEPHPHSAQPECLEMLKTILPRVDLFSPNAKEAGQMLSIPADSLPGNESLIEECCHTFMQYGAKDMVVVRSGALGACLLRRGWDKCRWVPAYHQDSSRVIDDTGAGNAFLGGLIAGLILTGDDLEQAALYGSVSASYTIEQYGLPVLNDDDSWNETHSRPRERLEEMRRRMHDLRNESKADETAKSVGMRSPPSQMARSTHA